MTNKEIENRFEEIFLEGDYVETSRLHSPEFIEDEWGLLYVVLFGGMNGRGEWLEYLDDVMHILKMCRKNKIYSYITKWDIDALDDLFKVEIQLGDLEEFTKENPE